MAAGFVSHRGGNTRAPSQLGELPQNIVNSTEFGVERHPMVRERGALDEALDAAADVASEVHRELEGRGTASVRVPATHRR